MRTLNLAFVVALAVSSVPLLATEEGNFGAVPLERQEGGSAGEPKGFPSGPGPVEILVVPAAAFASDGFLAADSYHFNFLLGAIEGDINSDYGCVIAPVHLPGDAYILEVRGSLYDFSPGAVTLVTLWRVNNYTGWADVMARVQTTEDGDWIQNSVDDTVAFPSVLLPNYSYYLTTCLHDSGHRVYGVRVYYSPALFMDGFESGSTGYWSATQP